jgi:nucleoside-diphosphate-sugar epimerase
MLVVGGAGYIGSVLVRHLLKRGYRVRVLDALLYDNGETLQNLTEDPRFEFLQGEFTNDQVLCHALVGITDVVLLAALVGDPICKQYPEQAKEINYRAAVGLLEALENYPIDRLIFTSTCSNYGIILGDRPANEEAPLRPLSLYAETKVAVERCILERRERVKYSPTILRIATAFGIGYRTRFDLTVNHFTRDLALGRELVVYDQATWRPYCHIEDIGQAIIRALECPRGLVAFQVFNVGDNSQNHSKEQLAEMIRQHLPEATVRYQVGGSDPRDYQVDFGKIRRVLGFKTRHSVASGVEKLLAAIETGQFSDVEQRPLFYGNYRIPRFDGPVGVDQMGGPTAGPASVMSPEARQVRI